MAYSFTAKEKRFVLAEIIKSSTINIENLAGFVKSNEIVPNWMEMQLPHGRNMHQCMQVADSFSIPSSPLMNQSQMIATSQNGYATQNITDHPNQFVAMTGPINHHPCLPPATQPHHTILPRPATDTGDNRIPLPQAPKAPAKKRGRPPTRNKRDLHPNLPPIAPRLSQPAPEPNMLRAILPRTFEPQVSAPPSVHSASALVDSPRSKKRRRTAAAAGSTATATAHVATSAIPVTKAPSNGSVQPWVLAGKESTDFHDVRPLQSPRPVSLEPALRTHALLPAASTVPSSQIQA